MIEDISVIKLKERLNNNEDINLIDVRETFEFEEFNLGGNLIPLGELPGRLDEIEHLREKEIIVHCRSGNRSRTAQQFLLQAGFKNVRNLLGGVLDWQAQHGS
ncbi:MAG: rhodanese-like domain-containing protein [Bacteroidota bacterium]|nr:rhodanese-like domain-containing protein [Bacteroidota bacterium]